jgi:Adenylate and Guanylate cyclase catalytic domain
VEVFSLLQTLYAAMDVLAAEYNVWKVETIGDAVSSGSESVMVVPVCLLCSSFTLMFGLDSTWHVRAFPINNQTTPSFLFDSLLHA